MTTIKELEVVIGELASSVKAIEDKVGNLFQTKSPERTLAVAAQPDSLSLSDRVIQDLGESDPIPALYRETVTDTLNGSFGVHSRGSATAANFMFTIVVPEKYSSFTPEQKLMNGPDLRSKVIEYALGANGVKEWAELVYKNFTPDVQAMITADRTLSTISTN